MGAPKIREDAYGVLALLVLLGLKQNWERSLEVNPLCNLLGSVVGAELENL